MLPDWWLRMSAATGPAFPPDWTNAEVAAVTLLVFAAALALATATAADWPSDAAFLALVAGGVLVTWPTMIALTLAAVALALAVGGMHAWLAPHRTARIAAEAERRVAPALERFARDAGASGTDRRRPPSLDDPGHPP